MNKFSRLAITIVSVLFLAFSASTSWSQSTNGALVGVVRDATGAVIPRAAIVVTSETTGVTYAGVSNGTGEYRISNLPNGTYDIAVSTPGFDASSVKGLNVVANSVQTQDVALNASGQSTVVEVSAIASVAIDTTTVQLSSVFSQKETQDLPTSATGLGVLNLSLLAPGVASTGGLGAGTGPSVSGQRPRNNNFEIEGVDNNNKTVTGPLLYVPNDAIQEFSLLQNVFGAQYGHSTGGQFNSIIVSGTNAVHGRLYEYFDNRNLNAVGALQATSNQGNLKSTTNPTGVTANFLPRYDFNRYGGQLGGPVIKNHLFLFSNFERQSLGQSAAGSSRCSPTAAGIAALSAITFQSKTNFGVFKQYTPVANTQAPAAGDAGCPNGSTISVTSAAGVVSLIPVGDFSVSPPLFTNSTYSTSSGDYVISGKDSLHVRYVYNRSDAADTTASLPAFFGSSLNRYHLATVNETHVFTANVSNDFRVGYTRYYNQTPVTVPSFPGLSVFPNLVFNELNNFNLGPDPNAPQGTISNVYQVIDMVTAVRGRHTLVLGGEARKYIAPQVFVQRARGDYEYTTLNLFLNDLSPDYLGQRNALGPIGTPTFYGDQTAFYAYGNDDWRVSPTLTLNLGLRYEFTSIPASEKLQVLNNAISVPGLINFATPTPQKTNFAPRLGFAFAPTPDTSIRGGFGIGYDVLYDNIGTTEAPPQFQSTQNVPSLTTQTPNFLASGALPGTFNFTSLSQQRLATSAFVPNQVLPYSEQYTLSVEHVFHKDYTGEIRYVGTRGIHLDVQDQLNRIAAVTPANQLPTAFGGSTSVSPNGTNTQATLAALPKIAPAYLAAGLTSTITADVPLGSSNYNGLQTQVTRRLQNGLLVNIAYTFSKTMDNATADFNTTALNPRRPQDSQNVGADYSVSVLDRRHRFTAVAVYDVPFFKKSNWLVRNLIGNLELSPIYTFQSPQLTTPQSTIDSNLNNDAATDRSFLNPNGVQGTGSGVVNIVNSTTACTASTLSASSNAVLNGTRTLSKSCPAAIIGYAEGSIAAGAFVPSNAYYVQGGLGTLPNGGRNTLSTGRTNNLDLSAYKRISFRERYRFELGVQAYNTLNHPQFLPGSLNTVNSLTSTGYGGFDKVSAPGTFNQKQNVFDSNARALQLSGKFSF